MQEQYRYGEATKTAKQRFSTFAFLLLCVCLLLCAADCARAAADAFSLWWNSVLPALFPFYICISLLLQQNVLTPIGRAFRRPAKWLRLPEQAIPCFLLGAAAGYPTGARLCAELQIEGMAAYCNLCSPMFLTAVIAIGMIGEPGAILPLCVSHYASALLLLLFFPRRIASSSAVHTKSSDAPRPTNIISLVGGGMSAMLQIGGCISLFFVISELFSQFGVFSFLDIALQQVGLQAGLAEAMLRGLLEFTGGCAAVCTLAMPIRVTIACCAFLMSFGGVCVFLQTRLFLEGGGASYFVIKLIHALLAAAIAYFCTPLFMPDSISAMSQEAEGYIVNALSGGSLLLASVVAMFGTYLLALVAAALTNKRDALKTI